MIVVQYRIARRQCEYACLQSATTVAAAGCDTARMTSCRISCTLQLGTKFHAKTTDTATSSRDDTRSSDYRIYGVQFRGVVIVLEGRGLDTAVFMGGTCADHNTCGLRHWRRQWQAPRHRRTTPLVLVLVLSENCQELLLWTKVGRLRHNVI